MRRRLGRSISIVLASSSASTQVLSAPYQIFLLFLQIIRKIFRFGDPISISIPICSIRKNLLLRIQRGFYVYEKKYISISHINILRYYLYH